MQYTYEEAVRELSDFLGKHVTADNFWKMEQAMLTVLKGTEESESEYENGHSDGYSDGWDAAMRSNEEDDSNSYDEGYEAGYEAGLLSGTHQDF